jgi:protein-tyrosine phosphatase
LIDLHLHPLPFLDDGASDWDAAVEMARIAVADGVVQWVATPHWTGRPGDTDRVRDTLAELGDRLRTAGIPLRVHSGNEVVLVPSLAAKLEAGEALSLAESQYVLLETAQLAREAYLFDAVFSLQSRGYRLILAHPERQPMWQRESHELRELVYRGCLLQVNAGSLLGEFGPGPRRAAERLLRLGWVSFLASDGHSPGARPPRLSQARERCAALIGADAAEALVNANPARVVCGEYVPPPDPDPPSRRSWWGRLLRRRPEGQ